MKTNISTVLIIEHYKSVMKYKYCFELSLRGFPGCVCVGGGGGGAAQGRGVQNTPAYLAPGETSCLDLVWGLGKIKCYTG